MKKILKWIASLPWKEAWKAAAQVIVPAAIGAGVVGLTGCSSLLPENKTQSMGVYAFGIPGIAVITSTTQQADNKGEDVNESQQSNPVTVTTPITTGM